MGVRDRIAVTEKDLESQVKDLARLFGWKYYHTWRSFHSPAGFPDCVLVRPPRLIFAELKSEKGNLAPAQEEWLGVLKECTIHTMTQPMLIEKGVGTVKVANKIPVRSVPEVYLWRPSDFNEVVEVLR